MQVRVLHFVGNLSLRNGIASVVMNYYRQIDRTKIQFDFMIYDNIENSYSDEVTGMGGNIYLIPKLGIGSFLNVYKHLKKFFIENAHKYSIIHLHVLQYGFIFLPIAKRYGIKNRIIHAHSTKYSVSFFKSIRNWLMCLTLVKNANYYFACSKAAGKFLFGDIICKSDKFYLMKNAIDFDKFRYNQQIREKTREKLRIENKLVIGHVGRFSNEKNHTFLIDVFKELHSKYTNSVLLLVGDGILRVEIEKKVNKLGLSNSVVFTGTRNDVSDLLQAMDIFVFPSKFEGLGIVAVEAQASGLKTIVSDKVPEEVGFTNLFFSIELKKSAVEWANEIYKLKEYYRHDITKELEKSDYMINLAALSLTNRYFSMILETTL